MIIAIVNDFVHAVTPDPPTGMATSEGWRWDSLSLSLCAPATGRERRAESAE